MIMSSELKNSLFIPFHSVLLLLAFTFSYLTALAWTSSMRRHLWLVLILVKYFLVSRRNSLGFVGVLYQVEEVPPLFLVYCKFLSWMSVGFCQVPFLNLLIWPSHFSSLAWYYGLHQSIFQCWTSFAYLGETPLSCGV